MTRPRIVIADDHVEMARVVADPLADEGFDVGSSTVAPRPSSACRRDPPDLVVTDLRMKDVDGFDVLDAVHGDGPRDAGHHHDRLRRGRDRGRGDARGAYDYITKPFDPRSCRRVR